MLGCYPAKLRPVFTRTLRFISNHTLRWELPRTDRILFPVLCALLVLDGWRALYSIPVAAAELIPAIRVDRIVIAIAGIALYVLGRTRPDREEVGDARAFAIGAVCGCLFFARDLGFALVDPESIGWLLRGDWGQHYSGWAMFRHTAWAWPPGLLPEVFYPVGTSIVYTDSLPLLALLLKPLSQWLSEPFQYIGIWLLTNCILQGAFGALLTARVDRGRFAVVAGAVLFLFAPIFLRRLGHDTLMSHWLLLAALWLYFRRAAASGIMATAWRWCLLVGVAALVHPYLAVMTLAIQLADAWKRVRIDRETGWVQAGAAIAASLSIAAVLWWLAGTYIIPAKDGAGGVAYGRYSFNLLGFINPMGFSRLLPTLPSLPDQYEGFAYLGVGLLFLATAALIAYLRDTRRLTQAGEWRPLVAVAIGFLIFAASSVVVIGNWIVVNAPIEHPLLGVFRSSGRFAWIAYYAIMLAVLWAVLKRFRYPAAMCLLLAALVLQMVDLSVAHAVLGSVRLDARVVPADMRFDDARWSRLASGRTHLTMLPPKACGNEPGPYLPFQLFASMHGMTINTGFVARWDADATRSYCSSLQQQLAAHAFSADDLYVVGKDWQDRFANGNPHPTCERIDGYDACVLPDTGAR